MPESPEVDYQSNYIAKKFKGKKLTSFKILKGRYKTHGIPSTFKKFKKQLPLKLTHIFRKGKIIIMEFVNNWFLISRLGLTGTWHLPKDPPKWIKTTPNIEFIFTGGKTLFYTDPLSYGTITITNNTKDVQKVLKTLAPDIIGLKLSTLLSRIEEKPNLGKKKLVDVLVDQKALVSGIGNYLKSEILYDAKISPFRKVSSLTKSDWKKFLISSRKVIRRMKRVAGGDVERYIRAMKVYRQERDPFGNKVVVRSSKNGRNTFWVPKIQK
jgi:endonuclease-8